MNKIRQGWWFLRRREGQRSKEPGAALFQGLRVRLTLWYCTVLGVILVLFGIAIYLGAQYFLVTTLERDANNSAQARVSQWLTDPRDYPCSSFGPHGLPGAPSPQQGFLASMMTACFNQNGTLYQDVNTISLPSAFLSNSLAKTVLQTGQPTSDIVNAGGSTGHIYRSAVAIPNPTGTGFVGVVLVGVPIQTEENSLSLLLMLLLSIEGVALLGAG